MSISLPACEHPNHSKRTFHFFGGRVFGGIYFFKIKLKTAFMGDSTFNFSRLGKSGTAIRFAIILLGLMLSFTSVSSQDTEPDPGPILFTDKPDYHPLSTAIFSGNGFGPNEAVLLKVKNLTQPCGTTSGDSSYLSWSVFTDSSGHFETTWTVCNCPGDFLKLKAWGQTSGLYAEVVFADDINPLIINTLGTTINQNFDGMGSLSAAAIPTGFRVNVNNQSPDWNTGDVATNQSAGTSGSGIITGSSPGGRYNFANGVTGTSTDRAVGFLNSGSQFTPNHLILKITNNTGSTIGALNISFDYEKYRSGSRQFDWTFFHGASSNPNIAAASGNQSYSADANNTTVINPPGSINKNFSLTGLSIPAGTDYYLRWTFTGVGGSTNGQAIGIDNFSINAAAPPAATAGIYESYAIMNFGGVDMYYDLLANTGNPDFNGANLGTFNSSQSLYLDGAQNKTYKCSAPSDVLNGKLFYRVYPTAGAPGIFSAAVNLPFLSNDGATGCGGQNQSWQQAAAGINLLSGLCDGNYTVELYTAADINTGTATANNAGLNYKATFTVSNVGNSGIFESYAILNANGSGNTFYDLQANTGNPDFTGNLGSFCSNGTLVLAGGQNKVFKCGANDIISPNKLFYRIYPAGAPTGSFLQVPLTFISNDNGAGTGCQNQTWGNVTNTTNLLSGLSAGTYTLEVYTQAEYTVGGICLSAHFSNNGGLNFKANFTVVSSVTFSSQANLNVNVASGCTATVNYPLVANGTAPITTNYQFSGATTGSGEGTGSGSVFNLGTTIVR
jgi:hypothetical protein